VTISELKSVPVGSLVVDNDDFYVVVKQEPDRVSEILWGSRRYTVFLHVLKAREPSGWFAGDSIVEILVKGPDEL